MISVILVNWNGSADTVACIESLLAADRVPMRVIVVDNASPDNSVDVFERWAKASTVDQSEKYEPSLEKSNNMSAVQFGHYIEGNSQFHGFDLDNASSASVYMVQSGRNGGFGFGCNVGMRLADTLGTSSYWILNNDCVVSKQAVRRASETAAFHPGTVFGTIVRYFAPPQLVQVYGGGSFSRLTGKNINATAAQPKGAIDYIYGASMVFSGQARRAIGDFDEKIFMYYEEMDFCLRAKAAGLDFDVIDTEVFHKHGGSQGGVSIAAWTNVLSNKYYVLHKHFGWGVWTVVYFASLLARCVLPVGGKRASIGARNALKIMFAKGAQR